MLKHLHCHNTLLLLQKLIGSSAHTLFVDMPHQFELHCYHGKACVPNVLTTDMNHALTNPTVVSDSTSITSVKLYILQHSAHMKQRQFQLSTKTHEALVYMYIIHMELLESRDIPGAYYSCAPKPYIVC